MERMCTSVSLVNRMYQHMPRPKRFYLIPHLRCFLVAQYPSSIQSVSQGQISLDNLTSCNTEIKVAQQTCYLSCSQYTDTEPTSPITDPIVQGSHKRTIFSVNGMTQPGKWGLIHVSSTLKADALPRGH